MHYCFNDCLFWVVAHYSLFYASDSVTLWHCVHYNSTYYHYSDYRAVEGWVVVMHSFLQLRLQYCYAVHVSTVAHCRLDDACWLHTYKPVWLLHWINRQMRNVTCRLLSTKKSAFITFVSPPGTTKAKLQKTTFSS